MSIDRTRALEDEWIVVRCQIGERDAFGELICRWQEPLWKYIRSQVSAADEARDVAQDVWVRVLRGIAGLREGSKLRPWLFGIARRALMDRLRAQYAAPVAGEADLTEIPANVLSADLEEALESMHFELSSLPPIEREALTLFYLRELSLEEVADVLDVPVGTVKSRLFRARNLLKIRMASKGAFS